MSSFLDNSGDIILDAVLTDVGRLRLARGDGSFKIVKFALGDEEINYNRFQLNHPSGSAYADLEILQTPVLEAFTNNASTMQTKLITIPRNNILFLPILEINQVFAGNATKFNTETNTFLVAVNSTTETEFEVDANGNSLAGVIFGENPASNGNYIRLDQGLDTNQISPSRILDPLLVETSYMIEIDNRLGTIVSVGNNARVASLAFLDDDQIATYSIALGTDPLFVKDNPDTTTSSNQSILGPRGTYLEFKVQGSLELNTGTYLFDTLGTTETLTGRNGSVSVKTIDSTIRVMGVSTGYRVDIPVKFIKKV